MLLHLPPTQWAAAACAVLHFPTPRTSSKRADVADSQPPLAAARPLSVPTTVDSTNSLLAAQALIATALGQRPLPAPTAMPQAGPALPQHAARKQIPHQLPPGNEPLTKLFPTCQTPQPACAEIGRRGATRASAAIGTPAKYAKDHIQRRTMWLVAQLPSATTANTIALRGNGIFRQ